MTELSGKSVLITGASRGIGKAIATALAERGAEITMIGRSVAALEAVALHLNQGEDRPKPEILPADLVAPEQLQEAARALAERMPRLDVLIHCAGVYCSRPWSAVSEDEVRETFMTNVSSPMLLTQYMLPSLKNAGGAVVFINSSIVRSDGATAGLYAASKQALRSCANSLRAQVSKEGIRVLSVFPGRTATPLQEDIFRQEGRPYLAERLLQPKDVAEAVVTSLLLPVTADMTEIHIRSRIDPLSDPFTN